MIVSFLILEVLTRLFLSPSDVPDIYFNPLLGNSFVPNQSGVYIKGKNQEIKAKFRINNLGFNSPHDYSKTKPDDTYRVAIVGDSFIESLQVDYYKSYPYILENALHIKKLKGKKVEVYTFGHSGANLFHYTKAVEFVEDNFKPDLIIVNIVENDFKESIYGNNRKDNWSLDFHNGNTIEHSPDQITNLWVKRLLSKSALVRYLTINLDLINTSPILNKIFYAETREFAPKNFVWDNDTLTRLTNYSVEKLVNRANESENNILFILDTDREVIYNQRDFGETEHYDFNSALKKSAKKFSVPVVDLTETFAEDWQKSKRRFDWEVDDHWNGYGHLIIGQTLTKWFAKTPQ